MSKFNFKMKFASPPYEEREIFFEATFVAPSMDATKKFANEMSELYSFSGLAPRVIEVFNHLVTEFQ
jgi:hypothetical protein